MTEKLLPLTPPLEVSDELLKAEWGLEDVTNLFHFARNTLGFKKVTPHPHADLCDFLTNSGKYTDRLHNHWKLILLPRGTFKSTIAARAYPLWLLLRDPNTRVLLDSETYAKSVDALRAIKGSIITNETLRTIHGPLELGISKEARVYEKKNKGLLWNEDGIILGTRTNFSKTEPSISVSGVDVVKVGMHYDVVIGDDYHSEKNVTTKEQIDKVIQHIQLMTSILDPGATYVIIGTRWDDKDAYGWIIDEVESLAIRKPGIYKGNYFDIMIYPWKMPDSTLFAPDILNEETIIPLKAMHSPYSFSCQYMNDPIDSDSAIFKESWIKDHIISQAQFKAMWDGMVRFTSVDPAIGENVDNDYSAIVTMGFCTEVDEDGKINLKRVLCDVHYGRWNPEKLLDEIVDVNRKFRPVQIGFESVAGFEAFQTVFRERMRTKGIYLPLNYFKRDTKFSKDTRIKALAPMFQAGTFFIVKGCRGFDEFWEEYRRFPRAKHDDVLDALADIERVGYFPRLGDAGSTGPVYQPLDSITGY